MTNDMINRADAQKLLAKSDLLSIIVSLRLQAAFDALPAYEVGVKPLEWDASGWARDEITGDIVHYSDPEKQREYDCRRAARIRSALAANPTGKEVMPDDNDNSNPRPDTGPGVTAGAVLVAAVEALNAACDAMWNDHERIEENPSRFGQPYRLKEKHIKAISEAQQKLPAVLARMKEAGE